MNSPIRFELKSVTDMTASHTLPVSWYSIDELLPCAIISRRGNQLVDSLSYSRSREGILRV